MKIIPNRQCPAWPIFSFPIISVILLNIIYCFKVDHGLLPLTYLVNIQSFNDIAPSFNFFFKIKIAKINRFLGQYLDTEKSIYQQLCTQFIFLWFKWIFKKCINMLILHTHMCKLCTKVMRARILNFFKVIMD